MSSQLLPAACAPDVLGTDSSIRPPEEHSQTLNFRTGMQLCLGHQQLVLSCQMLAIV